MKDLILPAFILSFLIFLLIFSAIKTFNDPARAINQTKIELYCYEKGFLRSDFRYVHNHSLAVRCFDPLVYVVDAQDFQ